MRRSVVLSGMLMLIGVLLHQRFRHHRTFEQVVTLTDGNGADVHKFTVAGVGGSFIALTSAVAPPDAPALQPLDVICTDMYT